MYSSRFTKYQDVSWSVERITSDRFDCDLLPFSKSWIYFVFSDLKNFSILKFELFELIVGNISLLRFNTFFCTCLFNLFSFVTSDDSDFDLFNLFSFGGFLLLGNRFISSPLKVLMYFFASMWWMILPRKRYIHIFLIRWSITYLRLLFRLHSIFSLSYD